MGEICKYLTENRLERTQFWRRVGGVLEFDEVALEQEMRKRAGQRPQMGTVVGHCSYGAACPSREKRGGDRLARRERQRALRDRSRDDRVLSRVLASTLNPLQGGSVSRTAERPSKLQLLQQYAVAGFEEGKEIRSRKDHAIYVGITNPTTRSENEAEKSGEKTEVNDKKGQTTAEGAKQQNKAPRGIDDGLLLVVAARINGHVVRALIDSGATRCFVTPACVAAVGLMGKPQDTFLELGNC